MTYLTILFTIIDFKIFLSKYIYRYVYEYVYHMDKL